MSLVSFEEERASHLGIRATKVPPTNLLFVSRQFHQELYFSALVSSRLLIHDHRKFRTYTERLPPAALHSTNLRVFIYVGHGDRKSMGTWGFLLKATKQMPNLRSVKLEIVTDRSSDRWGQGQFKWLNGFCKRLARFYQFKAELVIDRESCDDEFWNPDVGRDLSMVWDEGEGRLVWVAEEAPRFLFYKVATRCRGRQ